MNISVVGLGKLGAPLAACLAHKGHTVIGVDANRRVVDMVNEGRAPVAETGLDEMMRNLRGRLTATDDFAHAISHTQATFIIVPTPSEPNGGFSLRYVLAAVEQIGRALRHKSEYHLVALTSTVLPGATGGQVLPALEAASGRRCGPDFGLCYNPEFVALGSVIRDTLNPELVLIGQCDDRAGEMLEGIHRALCDSNPHFARMNFVNAELAKLAVNTFVTTKISYANMLAEICERLPGADVDAVTAAIGADSRIGRKYLKGSVGYGGPCFPRDNLALAFLARQLGARPILAEATDLQNAGQTPRLAALALAHLPPGGTVGVLGLSYKPDTPIAEQSQGVKLAEALAARGVPVVVYDPQAMENARAVLGDRVSYASSLEDCLRRCDVVAITVAWPQFKQIRPGQLRSGRGRPTLIDCWRVLDGAEFARTANYIALGRGPARAG